MTATIHHGDCLDVLRNMPDNSVHAIVTDPPYGLSNTTPDQVAETIVKWVSGERDYLPSGRGFMGKAWDAFVPPVAVWDEARRVLKPGGHVLAFAGTRTMDLMTLGLRLAGFDIRDSVAWLHGGPFPKSHDVEKAVAKHGSESNRWAGWGTGLKPTFEPVTMGRKPLDGTVAENTITHGAGGINVNGCRIGGPEGRWPANVTVDEHAAKVIDGQSGYQKDGVAVNRNRTEGGGLYKASAYHVVPQTKVDHGFGGGGGASRFYYVAKASKRERPDVNGIKHPTVKPLSLMRWLARLVTPPDGIILDPFAGSGTTIEAAMLEGFQVIGIEREAEYLPLIHERIRRATEQLKTEQQQQAEAPDQGAFPLEDIA